MLVGSDPIFLVHREKLVALVAAAAIPTIYQYRDFTTAGGLISYDPDIAMPIGRAAFTPARF